MLSTTSGRFEFCQRTHTDIWALRTSSPSLSRESKKEVAVPWGSDDWRKIKKQPVEVDGIKRWMQSNPELVRQMEKRRQSAEAAAPVAPSSSRPSPPKTATSPRSARRQISITDRSEVTAKYRGLPSQLSRLIDAQHGFRPRYRDRVALSPRSGLFPPVAPGSHRGNPYRDIGLSVPDPFRPSTISGRPYGA